MLIYEIPYHNDKEPNIFRDSLAFITSNQDDYCFAKVKHQDSSEFICIIFAERFFEEFSPLLEVYEAKKLDKLPEFKSVAPLGGNLKLFMNKK